MNAPIFVEDISFLLRLEAFSGVETWPHCYACHHGCLGDKTAMMLQIMLSSGQMMGRTTRNPWVKELCRHCDLMKEHIETWFNLGPLFTRYLELRVKELHSELPMGPMNFNTYNAGSVVYRCEATPPTVAIPAKCIQMWHAV